jgi:hypothetical protein
MHTEYIWTYGNRWSGFDSALLVSGLGSCLPFNPHSFVALVLDTSLSSRAVNAPPAHSTRSGGRRQPNVQSNSLSRRLVPPASRKSSPGRMQTCIISSKSWSCPKHYKHYYRSFRGTASSHTIVIQCPRNTHSPPMRRRRVLWHGQLQLRHWLNSSFGAPTSAHGRFAGRAYRLETLR